MFVCVCVLVPWRTSRWRPRFWGTVVYGGGGTACFGKWPVQGPRLKRDPGGVGACAKGPYDRHFRTGLGRRERWHRGRLCEGPRWLPVCRVVHFVRVRADGFAVRLHPNHSRETLVRRSLAAVGGTRVRASVSSQRRRSAVDLDGSLFVCNDACAIERFDRRRLGMKAFMRRYLPDVRIPRPTRWNMLRS